MSHYQTYQEIQRCIRCDGPTGCTTEDAIQLGDTGPFCKECAERLAEAAPQMLEVIEEIEALIREGKGVFVYHMDGKDGAWAELELKVDAIMQKVRGEEGVSETKGCPFCGLNVTELEDRSTTTTPYFLVRCQECGARARVCRSKGDAIDAWNYRPIEDALRGTRAH